MFVASLRCSETAKRLNLRSNNHYKTANPNSQEPMRNTDSLINWLQKSHHLALLLHRSSSPPIGSCTVLARSFLFLCSFFVASWSEIDRIRSSDWPSRGGGGHPLVIMLPSCCLFRGLWLNFPFYLYRKIKKDDLWSAEVEGKVGSAGYCQIHGRAL